MKNMMEYKGYFGSVNYSAEDNILHGKIEFIRSLITYQGESIQDLKKNFEEAVDHYLRFCKEEGTKPEKPLKPIYVRS